MTAEIDCTLTIHRVDLHWDVPATPDASRALAEDIGRHLLERLLILQRRRAGAIAAGRVEPGRIDIDSVVVDLGPGRSPDPAAIADAIAGSLERRLS